MPSQSSMLHLFLQYDSPKSAAAISRRLSSSGVGRADEVTMRATKELTQAASRLSPGGNSFAESKCCLNSSHSYVYYLLPSSQDQPHISLSLSMRLASLFFILNCYERSSLVH